MSFRFLGTLKDSRNGRLSDFFEWQLAILYINAEVNRKVKGLLTILEAFDLDCSFDLLKIVFSNSIFFLNVMYRL